MSMPPVNWKLVRFLALWTAGVWLALLQYHPRTPPAHRPTPTEKWMASRPRRTAGCPALRPQLDAWQRSLALADWRIDLVCDGHPRRDDLVGWARPDPATRSAKIGIRDGLSRRLQETASSTSSSTSVPRTGAGPLPAVTIRRRSTSARWRTASTSTGPAKSIGRCWSDARSTSPSESRDRHEFPRGSGPGAQPGPGALPVQRGARCATGTSFPGGGLASYRRHRWPGGTPCRRVAMLLARARRPGPSSRSFSPCRRPRPPSRASSSPTSRRARAPAASRTWGPSSPSTARASARRREPRPSPSAAPRWRTTSPGSRTSARAASTASSCSPERPRCRAISSSPWADRRATPCPSPCAPDNVYFVDPATGNDGNPGTFAQPWATPWRPRQTMVAGDTVYLRGGTFSEMDPATPGWDTLLFFDASLGATGTAAAPIAYLGYPGARRSSPTRRRAAASTSTRTAARSPTTSSATCASASWRTRSWSPARGTASWATTSSAAASATRSASSATPPRSGSSATASSPTAR